MLRRDLSLLVLSTACACNPQPESAARPEAREPEVRVVIAQADPRFGGRSLEVCATRDEAGDPKYPCRSEGCECFDFNEDGDLVDENGDPASMDGLCPSANIPNADWRFDYTLFDGLGCTGVPLTGMGGLLVCYDATDLQELANQNASIDTLEAGAVNTNEIWCVSTGQDPFAASNFCQASRAFTLAPGAEVFGDIANSGEGTSGDPVEEGTSIGEGAVVVGSVVSVPDVQVAEQAVVTGDVASAGDIVASPDAVMGDLIPEADVELPELPELPPFPIVLQPGISAGPGETVEVQPGAYPQIDANGGTLIFTDGDYYVDVLNLSLPQVIVGPSTRFFVGTTLVYETPFVDEFFQAAPVLLGYYGTADLAFDTIFMGKLIAPNATVTFTPENASFTGEMYAQDIAVNPGSSSFVCTETTGPDL